MPSGKIIFDSDDEEDGASFSEPLPSKEISSTGALAIEVTGLCNAAETQKSAGASTGSTDLLNRDIKDAHRALMEPTPDSKVSNPSTNGSTKPPSQSPVMSRNKRRRTTAILPSEISEESASIKRRKPLETYGTELRARGTSFLSTTEPSSRGLSASGSGETQDGENVDEDVWTVPGSSPSRDPLATAREVLSSKVKSTAAAKGISGKDLRSSTSMRRCRTMGPLHRESTTEPLEDTNSTTLKSNNNGIPSSSGSEDDIMNLPKRKRLKRTIAVHPEDDDSPLFIADDKQKSLSDEMLAQSEPNLGNAIVVDLSDPALALTTSQKEQYTVPSKTPSQPDMTPTGAQMLHLEDPFARYPGESSTIPNTTPIELLPKDAVQATSTKTSSGSSVLLQHLLPSSPPEEDPISLVGSASQGNGAPRESLSSLSVQQSSSNAPLECPVSTILSTSPAIKSRRLRRSKTTPIVSNSHSLPEITDIGAHVVNIDTISSAASNEIKVSKVSQLEKPTKSGNDTAEKEATTDPQTFKDGSDEVAFGIPKEQYKPRPTRSRSTRNADSLLEMVDFSKRPEAQAKARIKRSKTEGAGIEVKSLAEDGDITSNMPKTVTGKKTRAKRKRTADTEALAVLPSPTADATTKDETTSKPDNAEVANPISPAVSPDTAGQKPTLSTQDNPHTATREQTPDTPSAELIKQQKAKEALEAPNSTIADTLPNPKRRGRPRNPPLATQPRKRRKTTAPRLETWPSALNTPDVIHLPETSTAGHALEETDGNKALASSSTASKPTATETITTPSAQESTNPIQGMAGNRQEEVRTPQKSTPTSSPASKGPSGHSPLPSSKVAYRVGLSRRARIAPLLRLVKK